MIDEGGVEMEVMAIALDLLPQEPFSLNPGGIDRVYTLGFAGHTVVSYHLVAG